MQLRRFMRQNMLLRCTGRLLLRWMIAKHAEERSHGRVFVIDFFWLIYNCQTTDRYRRGLWRTSENVTEEDKLMASMVAAIEDIAEEKEAVHQAEKLKKTKQKKAYEAVLYYSLDRQRSKKKWSSSEIEVKTILDSLVRIVKDIKRVRYCLWPKETVPFLELCSFSFCFPDSRS